MHASDVAGINGISQIFTGTHLPARCVPLGPHTAPLTPCVGGWKNIISDVNDHVRLEVTRPQCFLDVAAFCVRNRTQSGNKLLLRVRTKEAVREEVASVCAKAHVHRQGFDRHTFRK